MTLERLVISCGGTGGHFYPGLSIAREFQRQGGAVRLLLGGKRAEEQIRIATSAGINAIAVEAAPLSARPAGALRFAGQSLRGIIRTLRCLREFRPDAMLAMGSYASLPPALAARLRGVPLYLHDGNAKVGKSNRFFSRHARRMALSFPIVNESAVRCPMTVTGLPLRAELVSFSAEKTFAQARLSERYGVPLDASRPTVLVFGGSQGAQSINQNFVLDPTTVPGLDSLQILFLAGRGMADEVRARFHSLPCQTLILEAAPEMELFYTASDLVVCRSGGSTISELALFGKFGVLIPFPAAAEDHQNDNARFFATGGGARIVSDAECSPELFQELIRNFLETPDSYRKNGEKSRTLARPDAAAQVLEMIRTDEMAREKN